MADTLEFYLNNDNIVHIRGLRFYDGEYINGGLVNFRVFDTEDNVIFDRQMEYKADSYGEYKVVIPHDTQFDAKRHKAELEAQSQTRRGFWEGVLVVQKRGFSD